MVSSDKFQVLFVDSDHDKIVEKIKKVVKIKCLIKKKTFTRKTQQRKKLDDTNSFKKSKIKTTLKNTEQDKKSNSRS